MGNGEADTAIESSSLFFYGLKDEIDCGDVNFRFGALESGRDCVDGVQDEVAEPAEET
jgi:hypothetical protein